MSFSQPWPTKSTSEADLEFQNGGRGRVAGTVCLNHRSLQNDIIFGRNRDSANFHP